MYSVYSRVLKIPIKVAALRKCAPLSINATSKVLSNISNDTCYSRKSYSVDTKAYDSFRRSPLQYMGYSILFSAVAYTSFKLW